MKEELIEVVIKQVKLDIEDGNYQPLEEMLTQVPEPVLLGFLSDSELAHYKFITKGESK